LILPTCCELSLFSLTTKHAQLGLYQANMVAKKSILFYVRIFLKLAEDVLPCEISRYPTPYIPFCPQKPLTQSVKMKKM
jgi:hypothetical protein